MNGLVGFARALCDAFVGWRSAGGEYAPKYFAGNRERHGGDEAHLRDSLIKARLLCGPFGYPDPDVEVEAPDRADLVLWAGLRSRPVIIVEAKRSSIIDLLGARSSAGETPAEQLERYVRGRGLTRGLLTNGETLHVFDFAMSRQPRATLSLVELSTVLAGCLDDAGAARRLDGAGPLRDALLIMRRLVARETWDSAQGLRDALLDQTQFHSQELTDDLARAGLVSQIKTEIGQLRDATRAQFALLEAGHAEYDLLLEHIDGNDDRMSKLWRGRAQP